jgi:hypothetical protein
MKAVGLVVAAGLLSVLAACTGSTSISANSPPKGADSKSGSASLANPCTLLTQAEASAALGMQFGAAEMIDNKKLGKRCRFATSGDELFIDISDNNGLADSYAHLPDATPVKGLGDKAVWMPGHIPILCIVKGNTLVNIGFPPSVKSLTPGARKVAELVASRM